MKILTTCVKINKNASQVWVTHAEQQFSVREARKESHERDSMRPRPLDIVPKLSARERAVFSYCTCKNVPMRTWITGHMQWVVSKKCILAKEAARIGESLIAGISGHTDLFMRGMCVFDYFDVRISTLICAVWLVGCDHHSLYEVVRTGMFYGLKACTEPCVPYLRKMLADVQQRVFSYPALANSVLVNCKTCYVGIPQYQDVITLRSCGC